MVGGAQRRLVTRAHSGVRATLAGMVLAGLVLGGCLETNAQLFGRLAPEYGRLRGELRDVARSLDTTSGWPPELDEPLVLDEVTDEANVEVLMYEHLLDPDWQGESDYWVLPRQLLFCLGWTGPKSRMVRDAQESPANASCIDALHVRYLLVLRTLVDQPPRRLVVGGYLFDRRTGRFRGAFVVRARSPFDEADLGTGPFARQNRDKVESELRRRVREGIERALADVPGARLRFDRGIDTIGRPRRRHVDELLGRPPR